MCQLYRASCLRQCCSRLALCGILSTLSPFMMLIFDWWCRYSLAHRVYTSAVVQLSSCCATSSWLLFHAHVVVCVSVTLHAVKQCMCVCTFGVHDYADGSLTLCIYAFVYNCICVFVHAWACCFCFPYPTPLLTHRKLQTASTYASHG